MTRRDRAQATVELALALPLVVVVLLVLLQIALVTRDAVALTGAARAAGRRAVVDGDVGAVRRAAIAESHLAANRLDVSMTDGAPGGTVTVTVRYRAPTDVPLVGAFVGDVDLSERLVVLRE